MTPRIALAALTGALLASGCGRMAVDGEVVDVAGEPIPGASVTLIGTQCMTFTDEFGKFSIPCVPETYTISIGMTDYITDNIEAFDATERKRYDVGRRVLVKIPDQTGLLMFEENKYTPMERGLIVRQKGGSGEDAYKRYCLPEASEFTNAVNGFRAGVYPFFDNESGGWRAFRADEEGCFYRMSPTSQTQWGVDYSEKANSESYQVAEGKKIVQIELTPGRYFIADWQKGFFTKDEIGENKGYGGYYLEVQ